MASYKVPQDVEADDKLIGPFTFRQFIYLIIVAMAIALAWALSRVFVGLAVIPLPVVIFFGALALPLRKDQPMEIYMAAIVSFYIKPRMRMWDPDGVESNIEIAAPKTVEEQRTKDITETEAERRFSYLANIVDTQGWAIRGATNSGVLPINNDLYLEAQEATDVLDTNTSVAHGFDQMMAQSTEKMKEEARERMFQASQPEAMTAPQQAQMQPQIQFQAAPVQTPTPQALVASAYAAPPVTPIVAQSPSTQTPATPNPEASFATVAPADYIAPETQPVFNPYPEFNQSVIQPLDGQHQATPSKSLKTSQPQPPREPSVAKNTEKNDTSTSETPVSADIINLANNSEDLSIETIAHEANRLKEKSKKDSDEVIISLR